MSDKCIKIYSLKKTRNCDLCELFEICEFWQLSEFYELWEEVRENDTTKCTAECLDNWLCLISYYNELAYKVTHDFSLLFLLTTHFNTQYIKHIFN